MLVVASGEHCSLTSEGAVTQPVGLRLASSAPTSRRRRRLPGLSAAVSASSSEVAPVVERQIGAVRGALSGSWSEHPRPPPVGVLRADCARFARDERDALPRIRRRRPDGGQRRRCAYRSRMTDPRPRTFSPSREQPGPAARLTLAVDLDMTLFDTVAACRAVPGGEGVTDSSWDGLLAACGDTGRLDVLARACSLPHALRVDLLPGAVGAC